MTQKSGKFGKKQKALLAVLAVVVIGGGTGLVSYNKKVQAEKIERIEKKEKDEYKKLSLQVNDSVKKAYETRNDKDIQMAETIIKKLKEQDQKGPKEKMTNLHSFLDLIKKTDQLLATAEKTKKDNDVNAAQTSINKEKDAYLAKDKKAHQARLDKLKKAIADQKAKEQAEKEKKEKEEKAKTEATQAAETTTASTEVQTTETPSPEVAAQQTQEVAQAVEQPTTPVDNGGTVTPATPSSPSVDNGGGNSGGSTGGGGNVTPTPTPTPTPQPQPEPTPTPSTEYDPMTPIGSGGLFGSAAEATAAGQAKALELSKQGKGDFNVITWDVKYTDGRLAGWTYELA